MEEKEEVEEEAAASAVTISAFPLAGVSDSGNATRAHFSPPPPTPKRNTQSPIAVAVAVQSVTGL